MAMTSNGFLFYCLPFLELYPTYICPADIPNCTHKDRCLNKNVIEINYQSEKSLSNWVERFNLECEEPYMVGMIGSAYFAGWMIGSIIMSRIGDLYGRKLPFYSSLVLSALAYFWTLFTKSLRVQILLMLILGLT